MIFLPLCMVDTYIIKDYNLGLCNVTLTLNDLLYNASIGPGNQTSVSCFPESSLIIPKSIVYKNKNYTIDSILDSSFKYVNIINLTLPETITYLDSSAFESVLNVRELNLSNINITSIPSRCFYRSSFKKIILSKYTKYIGEEAFAYSHIESIVLSNYIEGFGQSIFANSSLESIDLSMLSVEVIPDFSFYGCNNLKSVIFPNTVKKIGRYAFAYSSTSNVDIPSSLSYLGEYCFHYCNNIRNVNLSNHQIEKIGMYTFSHCYNIESVILSNAVTSIGEYAFQYTSLTTFNVPGNTESIGDFAFYNCKQLKSVYLKNSNVKNISIGCFENCIMLSAMELNNINRISERAFFNTNISTINFSKNLDIGSYAFSCSSLVNVSFANTEIDYIPDGLFKDCKFLENVDLPKGVRTIGAYTFENSSIKKITLYKSIEFIGEAAFADSDLTEINMYELQVRNLSNKVFRNCVNLASVKLPNHLESISSRCFERTSFLTIDFPKTLETISDFAFYNSSIKILNLSVTKVNYLSDYSFSYCINLSKIYINNATLGVGCLSGTPLTVFEYNCTISDYVFSNCLQLEKVRIYQDYIPRGAFVNCSSLVDIQFEAIKRIEDFAFANTGFTHIEFLPGLIYIGSHSFEDCKKIMSVDVSQSLLNYIPPYCFSNCISLVRIKLPDSITTIKEYAFKNTGLSELILPDIVTLEEGCFYGSKIKKVVIESPAITELSNYTFFSCTQLETIRLSPTIVVIGSFCFSNCLLLSTINLENIYTINNSCFENCTVLKDISLKSINTIRTRAFYSCSIYSILFSSGLKRIEPYSFASSSELVSADFSYTSLKIIPSHCFENCVNLKAVRLPPTIKTLSDFSFYNTGLTSIDCLGAKFIGVSAFQLSPITSIVCNQVTTLLPSCFEKTNLDVVDFSSVYIESVPDSAFKDCKNLRVVILPYVCTEIGSKAFDGCSFELFKVPLTVTSVGKNAFANNNGEVDFSETKLQNFEGIFTNSMFTKISLPETTTNLGSLRTKELIFYGSNDVEGKLNHDVVIIVPKIYIGDTLCGIKVTKQKIGEEIPLFAVLGSLICIIIVFLLACYFCHLINEDVFRPEENDRLLKKQKSFVI